ncbi:MAG: hypothetical protein WKF59_07785 [Chitinophagaceae bacterium]
MNATVYKSTGSWYVVKSNDGETYNARIKGKFKIDDITSTNPLAVGDQVEIEMENEGEGSVVINRIIDRKIILPASPRIINTNIILLLLILINLFYSQL